MPRTHHVAVEYIYVSVCSLQLSYPLDSTSTFPPERDGGWAMQKHRRIPRRTLTVSGTPPGHIVDLTTGAHRFGPVNVVLTTTPFNLFNIHYGPGGLPDATTMMS
jgi:hypothetical protein